MEGNIEERLQWRDPLASPPERDSDFGRWLKRVKNVQSKRDSIGIVPSQPEKPEVIRCVRGFVAWKFSGSAPEANLPSEQEKVSFPRHESSFRSVFS
jgi:hypothetical protein